MPAPNVNEKAPRTGLFATTRQILYFSSFLLMACIAAAELGLVSQQMQDYGNDAARWPGLEYKNIIGLLLFTSIITLLVCIGHAFAPSLFIALCVFIVAVFNGTGAGVLFQVAPFKADNCGNPAESFPVNWQPFADKCTRIVALEGLAWANWGLAIFIFIGIIADNFSFRLRTKPFYALPQTASV